MSSFAQDQQPEQTASLAFGPYELVRELRPAGEVRRHLAQHPELLSNHVAYRFRFENPRTQRRRFLEAVERSAALDIPHILRVEQFSLATPSEAWVISPYTGNQDGLLLLSDLVAIKGGKMDALEVTRVLEQLLEAVQAAHFAGVVNGPVTIDSIQVDRSGSLWIELYGVEAAMRGDADGQELRAAEIASVAAMAYRLLTGVEADSGLLIEPARLVAKLDPAWNALFAEALDPAGGFLTAADLLDAIPGRRAPAALPEVRVRSAGGFGLGRLRRSGTASRSR